jgi:hypothetical protein
MLHPILEAANISGRKKSNSKYFFDYSSFLFLKEFDHRNKYMEEKFHREKKTIELIETLVECIEN